MNQDQTATWKRALIKFREEKDGFFRSSHESPLSDHQRASFKGLSYFDPDPGLRFEVKLQRHPSIQSVIMTTSKESRQLFNKVGSFEFNPGAQKASLQVYQSAEREDSNLFVPFRDETSGKETYGAGRYLDLDVEHNDEYALDFNFAYNPFCAYSDDYVCPLPPHENWLAIQVRAGERNYQF